MGKDNKKKVQVLIQDIEQGNEEQIGNALKSLQVHGDISIIKPLIIRWSQGVSEKTEQQILSFIGDIKISDSAAQIVEFLEDNSFKNIRQKLLTTVWNSKVDYSDFLSNFVGIAVHGDFMEALECLTIIENMEGPFQEFQFLDAQVELSDFTEMKNVTEQKKQIMSEIAFIIKDLEQKHIEF